MKTFYKIILTAALAVPALLQSCAKDNVSMYSKSGSACSDTISFSATIQPLINQNCATSGCHDAATQASGYDFTNHGTIAAHANLMISAMRWESGVVPMPFGGEQLPDSLIQKFSCWIDILSPTGCCNPGLFGIYVGDISNRLENQRRLFH
jgi:hypothetical protein